MTDHKPPKLGATGEFPLGKLNEDDEGAVNIGIAADHANNRVVIQFAKPMSWMAFDPASCRALALLLCAKADDLDGGETDA